MFTFFRLKKEERVDTVGDTHDESATDALSKMSEKEREMKYGSFVFISEGIRNATEECRRGIRTIDWSQAPEERRSLHEKYLAHGTVGGGRSK